MVPLKVTLFCALLIALPYVLWQAWAFVAPGSTKHERSCRAADASSVFHVCARMAYCYFIVFGSSSSSSPVCPDLGEFSPDIERISAS